MNRSIRERIYKVKPLHSFLRYVCYNSGIIKYYTEYYRKGYKRIFEQIKESKVGKRCFIIGNGASLSPADLDMINGEESFASNQIFRIFEYTKWRPTYYLIQDRYAEIRPEEILSIDCENVFLSDYYCRFNRVLRPDFIQLKCKYEFPRKPTAFSEHIEKYYIVSPTVSYMAMQIAAYMGYSDIYLIGFDHNYQYELNDKNGIIKETKTKDPHFYKDKDPITIIANIEEMEIAYRQFKQYAVDKGINVKNVTRGGSLELFERAKLEDVL